MRPSSHPGTHHSSLRLLFYLECMNSIKLQIIFFVCSGKSDYVEPAKRAHIMAAPRGRGRGAFGQLCRPHDIFRQRKQNTSRPPSMHVDDFLAAEFKDVGPPTGLSLPKRPPKGGGAKPPTRGLFTGGTRGRGFQSHTRFFTPPAPKSVLLAGTRICLIQHIYILFVYVAD